MSDFLSPELLISAYQQGYFPMADENDGIIYWHCPDPRAIIPLKRVKPPRSLKQYLRKYPMEFRINTNFERVIRKCAEREDTWINQNVIDSYINFHYLGFAHSVESYYNGELVGGLYGISLGGAFFGESMFSDISNASKAAFYYLALRLNERGYILLDSQYLNDFTATLGAVEISKLNYMELLEKALLLNCKLV